MFLIGFNLGYLTIPTIIVFIIGACFIFVESKAKSEAKEAVKKVLVSLLIYVVSIVITSVIMSVLGIWLTNIIIAFILAIGLFVVSVMLTNKILVNEQSKANTVGAAAKTNNSSKEIMNECRRLSEKKTYIELQGYLNDCVKKGLISEAESRNIWDELTEDEE